MKSTIINASILMLSLSAGSTLVLAHGKKTADVDPGSAPWVVPAEELARTNTQVNDPASQQRGRQTYRNMCLSCHGESGRGDGAAAKGMQPPVADLVAHGPHHSDGDLAWKIRTGRGPMPGFGTLLKDEQIWDVVNYLRTLANDTSTTTSPHKHQHMH